MINNTVMPQHERLKSTKTSCIILPYIVQLKDCIQNTTAVCNLRQNSVQDKFSPKNFFFQPSEKILRLNFVSDCILSWTEFVSDFQCTFLSCLRPFDAYHH